MGTPIAAPKVTQGLKPGTDEFKGAWTVFPDGRQYLLPVLARNQKMTPVFDAEGNVSVVVEQVDPEVDRFFDIAAMAKGNEIVLYSATALNAFFSLLKYLLLKNYDMSTEQMVPLLTMTNQQMGTLFNTILLHVVKQ